MIWPCRSTHDMLSPLELLMNSDRVRFLTSLSSFQPQRYCTVILWDIHVSACVCTCSFEKRYVALFFSVWFVLSCVVFFLKLEKDCERTGCRSLKFDTDHVFTYTELVWKSNPILLMAGPDVNRKWKVLKEISLRLRWSNSSCCNDAFALIFFFPLHWKNDKTFCH